MDVTLRTGDSTGTVSNVRTYLPEPDATLMNGSHIPDAEVS
ncbi:hypothetical protein AB0D40_28765 [Streptomyces massasporeus]